MRQIAPTAAIERGDAIMRTVQAFTPATGDLSEQFDRTTGAQTSAKHLTWSYAAFITAAATTLALPLEPQWMPAIKANLEATLRLGVLVTEFELSDEVEPAPVFGA